MQNFLGIDKNLTEEEIRRKELIRALVAKRPELEGLYEGEMRDLNNKEMLQDSNKGDILPGGALREDVSKQVDALRDLKLSRQNDPNSYINDKNEEGLPADPERDAKLQALEMLKAKYKGK